MKSPVLIVRGKIEVQARYSFGQFHCAAILDRSPVGDWMEGAIRLAGSERWYRMDARSRYRAIYRELAGQTFRWRSVALRFNDSGAAVLSFASSGPVPSQVIEIRVRIGSRENVNRSYGTRPDPVLNLASRAETDAMLAKALKKRV